MLKLVTKMKYFPTKPNFNSLRQKVDENLASHLLQQITDEHYKEKHKFFEGISFFQLLIIAVFLLTMGAWFGNANSYHPFWDAVLLLLGISIGILSYGVFLEVRLKHYLQKYQQKVKHENA